MNATEIAALCADLLNAFGAADAVADDTALFDVEAAALDTLLAAEPATYEGCARKAAALLEWYEKAGADNAGAVQVIVTDTARLAGLPAVERRFAVPEKTPMNGKVAWTVKEWSAATSICRALVFRLVADNRVKSVKHGARRLIITPPADYLNSLLAGAH